MDLVDQVRVRAHNWECVCGCALYKELERELELQVGLKQEMEVAMRLLEKDTHEKQDTLAALRLQLDQVKTLNLQMFHKAQVSKHAQRCLSCLEIQTPAHTRDTHMSCVSLQDSQREAVKKQQEASQLEERMGEMERAMIELEQRQAFLYIKVWNIHIWNN